MDIDPDIIARLQADFLPDEADARLTQLSEASESQRVLRCIVFAAQGRVGHFDYLCKLAKIDWRDVIMAAEYDRENTRLYDFTRPIDRARINDPFGKSLSAE
jgi:hypothetical protein